MTNWLYLSQDYGRDLDLMKKATQMLINSDADYPKEQFTQVCSLGNAVYANRMFTFRYRRILKARLGQVVAGTISHHGIYLVYKAQSKIYPWEEVTGCKIYRTINNKTNSNERAYYYDIHLEFGSSETFKFNAGRTQFFEFGGKKKLKSIKHQDRDDELVAELFAIYYNRMRSERLNIILSKGNKTIYLHEPVNLGYKQEILSRFHSADGVILKKKLGSKRLEFNQNHLIIYKKTKKKTLTIINWEDIEDIKDVNGGYRNFWLISYKPGIEHEIECFHIMNWKLIPKIKMKNKVDRANQSRMILPLCWLETSK